MSKQLDNLITILRGSSKGYTSTDLCCLTNCDTVSCNSCPFNNEKSLSNLVEELEVLQHAKA